MRCIFINQIVFVYIFLVLGYENIASSPERFRCRTHSESQRASISFFSLCLGLPFPSLFLARSPSVTIRWCDSNWITTFVDADDPENRFTRKSLYLRRGRSTILLLLHGHLQLISLGTILSLIQSSNHNGNREIWRLNYNSIIINDKYLHQTIKLSIKSH